MGEDYRANGDGKAFHIDDIEAHTSFTRKWRWKTLIFSILCRWTWWTTFVLRPISDSLLFELQNFLKCDGQIQHNAFLYIVFKKIICVCVYIYIF